MRVSKRRLAAYLFLFFALTIAVISPLGTAVATTTVALATVTQVPAGSNTGTFSGNTGFWNSTTRQNSGVLTGSYTTDTLTTRATGTTNILGAASFAVYQLSTNQFVLIGTTSSDTGAVLMVF
jgi:hypothetical protein